MHVLPAGYVLTIEGDVIDPIGRLTLLISALVNKCANLQSKEREKMKFTVEVPE